MIFNTHRTELSLSSNVRETPAKVFSYHQQKDRRIIEMIILLLTVSRTSWTLYSSQGVHPVDITPFGQIVDYIPYQTVRGRCILVSWVSHLSRILHRLVRATLVWVKWSDCRCRRYIAVLRWNSPFSLDIIHVVVDFRCTMTNNDVAHSCDTFVVLPPLTDSNLHIFGKNSDRPADEVQEIIFVSDEHTSSNKDHVQVGQSFRLCSGALIWFVQYSALIFKSHKSRKHIAAFYPNLLGVGERK